MILNLGCGEQKYGDIRADLTSSLSTNLLCDAHFLPFKDNVFSIVYSRTVFEHLPNPFMSLKDQKRVLKPNGKLVLVTDNASYWRFHVLSKSIHVNYKGRSEKDKHFMFFMRHHLVNFFKDLDLNNITTSFEGDPRYRITGAINAILRFFPSLRHVSYERIRVEARK